MCEGSDGRRGRACAAEARFLPPAALRCVHDAGGGAEGRVRRRARGRDVVHAAAHHVRSAALLRLCALATTRGRRGSAPRCSRLPPGGRRDIDNEASWGYLAALQSPRARVPGGSAPAPDRGSAGAGTRAQVPSAAVADIARGAMELEPDCRFAIAALADWNEAAAHRQALSCCTGVLPPGGRCAKLTRLTARLTARSTSSPQRGGRGCGRGGGEALHAAPEGGPAPERVLGAARGDGDCRGWGAAAAVTVPGVRSARRRRLLPQIVSACGASCMGCCRCSDGVCSDGVLSGVAEACQTTVV